MKRPRSKPTRQVNFRIPQDEFDWVLREGSPSGEITEAFRWAIASAKEHLQATQEFEDRIRALAERDLVTEARVVRELIRLGLREMDRQGEHVDMAARPAK